MRVPDFTVRYLGRDEAARWASLGAAAGADLAPVTNRLIPLLHDPARETAEFIVAEGEGRLLGIARAEYGADGVARLYHPQMADPDHVGEIGRSLVARFLAEVWTRHMTEVRGYLLLDKGLGDPAPLIELYRALGFRFLEDRTVMRRDLMDFVPSVAVERYSYHALHGVGNQAFVEVMHLIGVEDPEAMLLAMREAAGALFDAELWKLVREGERAVGVLIPQPLPEAPTIGDLFYFGLIPEACGKGGGQLLVEKGLALLKAQWVTSFQGACTTERCCALYTQLGMETLERQLVFAGPQLSVY